METNQTRNHEVSGLIPGLAQWIKDLALLWLRHSPVATALCRPLAWETPHAVSAALKRQKTKNKNKKDDLIVPVKHHCSTKLNYSGIYYIQK